MKVWVISVVVAASAWGQDAAFGQDFSGTAGALVKQVAEARRAVSDRDRGSAFEHIQEALSLADAIARRAAAQPKPILVVLSDRDGTSGGQLDITAAAVRLDTARSAVEQVDWTAAATALDAIPDSILRPKVENSMPLFRARQRLEMARARVLEGRYGDAADPLRDAARALADYEKLSPGPHAEEAEVFRQQILDYAAVIARDHADAADRIQYLWLGPIDRWYTETIQ